MSKGVRPGRLLMRWSRRLQDWVTDYPDKHVDHLIVHSRFTVETDPEGKTFFQELEERGYDLKTIRFQVDLKR